ncbi:MAG TPA: hypothetical protein VN544_03615, partial [Gaiellaceae bacterium]|nr:hypothetical protein [Gaiellaceae bacterium]
MAVHSVRLHERHRGRHGAEELVGDGLGGRRRGGRGWCGLGDGAAVACRLEKTREPGMRRDDVAVAALEQPA